MPKSQDPSKMSDYEKLLEMARVFRIPKKEVIKLNLEIEKLEKYRFTILYNFGWTAS